MFLKRVVQLELPRAFHTTKWILGAVLFRLVAVQGLSFGKRFLAKLTNKGSTLAGAEMIFDPAVLPIFFVAITAREPIVRLQQDSFVDDHGVLRERGFIFLRTQMLGKIGVGSKTLVAKLAALEGQIFLLFTFFDDFGEILVRLFVHLALVILEQCIRGKLLPTGFNFACVRSPPPPFLGIGVGVGFQEGMFQSDVPIESPGGRERSLTEPAVQER